MRTVAELVAIVPMLANLPATERENLERLCAQMTAKSGKMIMQAGSDGDALMFLASGRVKVCNNDERGKEVIIVLFGPGDFFGELSLLTNAPRAAHVIALEPAELLVLQKKDFYAHIAKFSGLTVQLLNNLAKRVQFSTRRITDLALCNVFDRIGRVLVTLGQSLELHGEQVIIVNDPPSHQHIASMAGTSREVVTRTLRALEEAELLLREDDRIVLKKRDWAV